jgi:lipoic acid synthetase
MPNRHFKTDPKPRTERLPPWFKVRTGLGENYQKLRRLVTDLKLHTVCESARCPNIWECWNAGTATFMILGNLCTRSCGFCAVPFGRPTELDLEEPRHVAEAVDAMGLTHAVITSVNRDELVDGGAKSFARTILEIRARRPACTVEVLIPDFQGMRAPLESVLAARPDILAHNTETVPRLHPLVRPQAKYDRSLQVLRRAKEAGFLTKTGVMLGLGETADEVREVMADLVRIRCDIFTLGQYLQPSAKHLPVARFWTPEEFQRLKEEGEAMGVGHVEAGPLVRSSYHAERQVKKNSPS